MFSARLNKVLLKNVVQNVYFCGLIMSPLVGAATGGYLYTKETNETKLRGCGRVYTHAELIETGMVGMVGGAFLGLTWPTFLVAGPCIYMGHKLANLNVKRLDMWNK